MLSKSAVHRVKDKLKAELGQANATRIETIAGLINEQGQASLADVLAKLYPGLDKETALTNFRQLRSIVKAVNRNITLETDGQKKRSHPASRAVWFDGDDPIIEAVNQITDAEAFRLIRTPQHAVQIGTRQPVMYEFAHANREGADLIDQLETHFKTAANYRFERRTGQEPDLVIELVSPRYLAERERGQWLCRVVPVDLGEVNGQHSALGELRSTQRFRHNNKSWKQSNAKDEFVSALFGQICKVLEEPWTPDHKIPRVDLSNFTQSQGSRTDLDKLDPTLRGEREDAVKFLTDWYDETNGPRYCALLGEYGIGKTTTAKKLALDLRAQKQTAIYLDLRLVGDEAKRHDIELVRILTILLTKSWKAGRMEAALQAEEAVKLVRDHGALMIFDGLDEVLVHLTPVQGQHFTRELFRALPPSVKSKGKLLFTCRSHYFRSFRDQVSHFQAEDRDGVKKEDYRAFVLLPFKEDQIRDYLKQTLPAENPDRVIEVFESVHNLREMAERPYTLSLLVERFAEIEEWKQRGEKVTGYRLYEHMVRSWVERDKGKHTLEPDHKMALMEYLAAELHKSGKRTWKILDVETWVLQFLKANDTIAIHYDNVDRNLIKEDLRTATFLVREGDDEFRFAHTSLQEFFLAGYLRRALLDNAPERWAIPKVSPETLDFLGQALSPSRTETLQRIRDNYTPQASELAFEYFLLASEKDYPRVSGAGFQLPGIDLFERTIRNVDLSRSNFTGANLRKAEFIDCKCNGAIFDDADLTGAFFRDCDTRGISTISAKTYQTSWNRGEGEPSPERRVWPLSAYDGAVLACAFSPDGSRVVTVNEDSFARIHDCETGDCVMRLEGHFGAIHSCCFSPNGKSIVTGGSDGTARVWDAEQGELVGRLERYRGTANACSFSPDGSKVLTGWNDGEIHIWDAATRQRRFRFAAHEGGVNTCCFILNGSQIVSAGKDGLLKRWSANGQLIDIFARGESPISACGANADGSLIAAACGTSVRLFDAATGETLSISAPDDFEFDNCSFDPTSKLLFVGGASRIRKFSLPDLEHAFSFNLSAGTRCLWVVSPDGTKILNGAADLFRIMDIEWRSLAILNGLRHRPSRSYYCAYEVDTQSVLVGHWPGSLWESEGGKRLDRATTTDDFKRSPEEAFSFGPNGYRGEHMADFISDPPVTYQELTPDLDCFAYHHGTYRAIGTSRDRVIRIWDVRTGQILQWLMSNTNFVDCFFWPGGKKVVSVSDDHGLHLWNAETGEREEELGQALGPITCHAFSPDQQLLAFASETGVIRIVGAFKRRLAGHRGAVRDIGFSEDSRLLCSVGDDGTLRQWDLDSGEETNWRGYDFPDDGWFTTDIEHTKILAHGKNAWRHVRWQVRDDQNRVIGLLPAGI